MRFNLPFVIVSIHQLIVAQWDREKINFYDSEDFMETYYYTLSEAKCNVFKALIN